MLRQVFEGVTPALRGLADMYPSADIPRVVERQPYLLISDCRALLEEMMRWVDFSCTVAAMFMGNVGELSFLQKGSFLI